MKHIPEQSGQLEAGSAQPTEIQNTVNWDSPKLELYESARCGTGVRTKNEIAKGETVGVFGGHIISLAERKALLPALEHFYFQVSDDLILTHISLEQIRQSKIEFINHSCEPNVGFRGQIELVALRDIEAGEAIAFDYATCTSEPEFKMECFCGTSACRKYVTGEDWKIPALQERYKGHFQPYLERKILGIRHGFSRSDR